MKILAISQRQPGADPAAFAPLAAAEAAHVWTLYTEGTVRAIYFDADRKPEAKGILELEAASREDAMDVLATLPMVAAGLISFELYVLGPYRQLALGLRGGVP